LVFLAQIREIPSKNMILLVGPPGSGKSTFCHQVVLSNIAIKPIIYVTTESAPFKVEDTLRQSGLGEVLPHPLGFVDAFHETVGLPSTARSDTVNASSEDLTSLSIAIFKLRERMAENVLLIFDSLTSPYLISSLEILRFIRTTLLKLAAESDAILACIDEGCGKPEDLIAMMSIADGIVKIETEKDKRLFKVVKHPKVKPAKFEAPLTPPIGLNPFKFDRSVVQQSLQAFMQEKETWLRKEVGDFVNLFWPNLAHWSGMLWDPKRFPTMIYEVNKQEPYRMLKEYWSSYPLKMRLAFKLFMPRSLSKVKHMKRMAKSLGSGKIPWERGWIAEYLEDISKTDEHYVRLYESYECWGFEHIGATIASHFGPENAGGLMGFESLKGLERDWNVVETKCIGLGDPYCEFKFVPGEIDGLEESLEKDSSVIERIHERLMQRLTEFLVEEKPLVERPRLGSDIHIHPVMHAMGFPHVTGERYQMALRMGGAKAGKEIGSRLMDAGLREDEAVKRLLHLLEYCKVGKVTTDETIRMKENCESMRERLFATNRQEPSCYFTTGFLNGFFSAVKNQHIRETKCIGIGDPYCEWEFR
jgi:predicted hydrocarbon binding protein/KaiC/GvpD/RAD55 family RecA-like ATPase